MGGWHWCVAHHSALGPANPYQEYTAKGDAAGTKVHTTTVSIRPAMRKTR